VRCGEKCAAASAAAKFRLHIVWIVVFLMKRNIGIDEEREKGSEGVGSWEEKGCKDKRMEEGE
jgi:hypothetical protein